MNSTILNPEQFSLFSKICEKYMDQIHVIKLSDSQYRIKIPSDDLAFECHDNITEYLQLYGFGEDQEDVNSIGRVCEELIDKFCDDMNI